MIRAIQDRLLGSRDTVELKHRCYNGVCLTASAGCLTACVLNTIGGLPLLVTVATFFIGSIYLGLYAASRRQDAYRPVLWLYVLSGVALLILTWFYNGGITGADTFVSMVALVAMTVVLKSKRVLVTMVVFFPVMSALFLLEYRYPGWVIGYNTRPQQFFDVYFTFVIATLVILTVIDLILQAHDLEKRRLHQTQRILEDKMEDLERTNRDVRAALSKVKTLSGLLPICSSCKNIRNDQGYWDRIESYIQRHSDAEFSHGICPQCARKLYPDLMLESDDGVNQDDDVD
jgi:hypothetical protein